MEKSFLRLLTLLLLALLVSVCLGSLLPTPLSRASRALEGLMSQFMQKERGGAPVKRPLHCPCFTCAGVNCTQPLCDYCSKRGPDACASRESQGCYTTNKAACYCNDPAGPLPRGANTAASFLFSCGQMGGLVPWGKSSTLDKCLCESDWLFACTNCYRWWSAVALEAAANFCMVSKNSSMLCAEVMNATQSMWFHSPYNAYWNASAIPVYIDDFAWYAQLFVKLYEWTGDEVWRQRAVDLHDWAWKYGWDHRTSADGKGECGGFYWNLEDDKLYKDSISIVEVLFVAAKLATFENTTQEDKVRFSDSAKAIWDWLFAFDDGHGLIAPNGVMSTAAVPEKCCKATSPARVNNFTNPGPACANSRVPGMSYNHGLLMSSAALMYKITSDKSYLDVAFALLDAAVANLTDEEGAVKDVQRGSRVSLAYECSATTGDPGSDFFSFKGIFVTHLFYFAEILKSVGELTHDEHQKLLNISQRSSDNAWTRSADFALSSNETDVCNPQPTTGVPANSYSSTLPKNATEPIFYWWWSTPNGTLETPPDNRLWFDVGNSGALHCNYHYVNPKNGTLFNPVIFNGSVASQSACKARCANDSRCTKYMFYGYEAASNTAPCKCYACNGRVCTNPECIYCSPKNQTCPKKTSQGCYTLSPVACNCPGSGPPQPSYNCWLYRLYTHGNRTAGPACTSIRGGYQVVVKRPPTPSSSNPGSSCRNRCGNSTVPSDIRDTTDANSISCFCDDACARHLDCCLDYVEECHPEEGQHPTCKGRCNNQESEEMGYEGQTVTAVKHQLPVAVPIRGGGYCYCFSGCFNYFTDNNSLGGCCADMPFYCMGAKRDPVCRDPRTEAQALQVFLSHHVLETIAVP